MTAEEVLACELINYIEAQPSHYSGLCYYLRNGVCAVGRIHKPVPLIAGYSYDMVGMVMASKHWDGKRHNWVDDEDGPTPERLRLAQLILDLTIEGTLYFDPPSNSWKLRQ